MLAGILWALSVTAIAAAIVIHALRRALPRLPHALPPTSPPARVVVLKPVLSGDAATLARCRAWIASAAAYPGRSAVVFSTVEPLAETLSRLAADQPAVEVAVVAEACERRRQEPGLDKVHRLTAAEEASEKILAGGDGVLLACDEDVEPVDPRCVERLVAAVPRPGTAATVTNAPVPGGAWFSRVGAANMVFNNQVYALANLVVKRSQRVLLGWTMALWASDLRAVGGFGCAARELTEEVALGVAFARRGVRTRLFDDSGAFAVQEHPGAWLGWWQQQVRWRAQLRACPVPVLAGLLLLAPLSAPVLAAVATFVADTSFASGLLSAGAFLGSARMLSVPPQRLWVLPCQELLTLSALGVGLVARRVRWGVWEYRTSWRSEIRAKRWLGAPRPSQVA